MPLPVTRLPAFNDNYLWLAHGTENRVAAVDPGDAAVVAAALERDGLTLAAILVTHHHGDHTGGVPALAARADCPVYGPAAEAIAGVTHPVRGGDRVELHTLGLAFDVIDVPGHTRGHVAYVGHGALFCGDTLFSGGCGRLFEGTPAQMLASLDTLAALPQDTAVYCAHEYTAANLAFARAVEPNNADLRAYAEEVAERRARGAATVPCVLGRERRINPFLRSREPTVSAAVWQATGVPSADAVETFRRLREWKNGFR